MEDYKTQQPQSGDGSPLAAINPTRPPQSPFRRWIPIFAGVTIVGFAIGIIFAWQFSKIQEQGEKVVTPQIVKEFNRVVYWTGPEDPWPQTVFQKDKGDFNIWTTNLSGTDKRKVLSGEDAPIPRKGYGIKVSPSGKIIFLTTDRKSIWVSDINTGKTEKIADVSGDFIVSNDNSFAISNDGRLVAYSIESSSSEDIVLDKPIKSITKYALILVDSNGKNSKIIDSEEIETVVSYSSTTGQISIISGGSRIHQLIPIKFSSDNKKLFAVDFSEAPGEDKEWKISIIDLDTGNRKQYEMLPLSHHRRVSISPDGSKLLNWEPPSITGAGLGIIDLNTGESKKLEVSTVNKIVGWLTDNEVVYERLERLNAVYGVIDLAEDKDKILFSSPSATDAIVVNNKIVYKTFGAYTYMRQFAKIEKIAELFITDSDGSSSKKLDEVSGVLTIIGLTY